VVAANVRKIRTFLYTGRVGNPLRGKRPRRRVTESIKTWRPKSSTVSTTGDPDPPLIA